MAKRPLFPIIQRVPVGDDLHPLPAVLAETTEHIRFNAHTSAFDQTYSVACMLSFAHLIHPLKGNPW